jgi:hypothetical protein
MSAPTMPPPPSELERIEAEFLRSPSSTWPLPAPAEAVAVDVPPSFAADEDTTAYKMTIVRTTRYCCV